MALHLPIYHMKYSLPDRGTLDSFHILMKHEADYHNIVDLP